MAVKLGGQVDRFENEKIRKHTSDCVFEAFPRKINSGVRPTLNVSSCTQQAGDLGRIRGRETESAGPVCSL